MDAQAIMTALSVAPLFQPNRATVWGGETYLYTARVVEILEISNLESERRAPTLQV